MENKKEQLTTSAQNRIADIVNEVLIANTPDTTITHERHIELLSECCLLIGFSAYNLGVSDAAEAAEMYKYGSIVDKQSILKLKIPTS